LRVLLYSQHVLGVGHVFRVLEIARALKGHQVYLVTGGPKINLPLPEHVTHLPMPGLRMDQNFSGLFPVEGGRELEEVKQERLGLLQGFMQKVKPHALVIELFPFGRKAFRFELLPVLEDIRKTPGQRPRVICSLRDILVEKTDQAKFERRALEWLNGLFDALIVHSDPGLIPLDETFSRVDQIKVPLYYTGFVTPVSPAGAGEKLREELGVSPGETMLLASAGGGNVGRELPRAALEAAEILSRNNPIRFFSFSGPYVDPDELARLKERAARLPWARVRRFTQRFMAYMDAADLSLSLAGYNTTLNLLSCGTYGLVLPFAQNREQHMRSERLAQRGVLGVLQPSDLEPGSLARRMSQALLTSRKNMDHGLDLKGGEKTAHLIAQIVGEA
jgi:predicted glycosyltransferase